MIKRTTTILLCLCLWQGSLLYGQEPVRTVRTPDYAIKTNLLSDIATTLNVAGEIRLDPQNSLELSLSYNPWSFTEEKKMKQFLIQPEYRRWLCETFNGTFLGVHMHYGRYNVGGIGFNDHMKAHRYEGWLVGAGVSVGYHWMLSHRLSLEATLGVGYAYMNYGVFPCEKCGEKIKDKETNYFGPTRLAVSLVYILK